TLNSQTLQEIHELVTDLRPSLLDNLGLVSALRSQVATFQKRTGISAAFTNTGHRRRIDPDLEMTIYRILQEALTNIAKHATPTQVKVRLVFRQERLCLRIRDNGQGFDAEQVMNSGIKGRAAWGLLGMQERISLTGGYFFIKSNARVGTIIQVCIPCLTLQNESVEKMNRRGAESAEV
ncbi:MAG: hypothetical protein GWP17_00705, partial [Aquificales bacterium]|nr:hypothetical protein [Aquificales bacterium]